MVYLSKPFKTGPPETIITTYFALSLSPGDALLDTSLCNSNYNSKRGEEGRRGEGEGWEGGRGGVGGGKGRGGRGEGEGWEGGREHE